MDLRELLGCIVLMLGGLYLLQQDSINFRKFGMALLWVASGLGAYFLTKSVALAFATLALWILFPLWEMVLCCGSCGWPGIANWPTPVRPGTTLKS